MPPLFGVLSKWIGIASLPLMLGVDLLVMIASHRALSRGTKR